MIIFCLRQPKPVSILLASLIMLSTHLSVTKANNDVENASNEALTKKQADIITAELWDLHCKEIELTRQPEMESRKLKLDNVEMPFWYQVYGDKPETGHSLYISLHGGGGVPEEINDQQWENQKNLYQISEGIYLVPRAPTNSWNMWHQAHVDKFLSRLIENLIVLENVDPNRVYIMGYSAGGDGTYQLGPRMADRWAGVAVMAGHPNDSKPDNLRNTAFTLHMGAMDSAYNRNQMAETWKKLLGRLQENDPNGYKHLVQIYRGKGHWMQGEDQVAIPWMAENTRNLYPGRVIWLQDNVTHNRFYWLAVKSESILSRSQIIAERNGQKINIKIATVPTVTVRLNDDMLDLELPVEIHFRDQLLFKGKVERRKAVIEKTILERGDYKGIFSAEVTVTIPVEE